LAVAAAPPLLLLLLLLLRLPRLPRTGMPLAASVAGSSRRAWTGPAAGSARATAAAWTADRRGAARPRAPCPATPPPRAKRVPPRFGSRPPAKMPCARRRAGRGSALAFQMRLPARRAGGGGHPPRPAPRLARLDSLAWHDRQLAQLLNLRSLQGICWVDPTSVRIYAFGQTLATCPLVLCDSAWRGACGLPPGQTRFVWPHRRAGASVQNTTPDVAAGERMLLAAVS